MTIRSLVLPRTEEDHATQQWVLAGTVLIEHAPRGQA